MKESFKGHGHDNDVDDDNVDGGLEINLDDHAAPGKEGITSQHETNISERASNGDHSSVSDLGTNQAFDLTTKNYVPAQEETLGWSRTNKPTPLGSENQPNEPINTPVIAQSTGSQSTGGFGVARKPKLGGFLEKDHHVEDVHPAKYQAQVNDATSEGYGSTTAQDIEFEQGGETPRQHEGNLDEGATIEGVSHTPESKPVEYQTFDTTTSIYIPGEVETLGRSRTDTGGSKLSQEQLDSPTNTPVLDRRGHYHTGVPEIGEMEKFAKHEDRPSILEKDPHASRDVGEKLHAENYQTELTDPTGRGAEEIEGTPILHELGKMNIHEESTQKLDLNTGQQEDQYISIGNHDQFSPEAVTKPQLDATIPTSQRFHEEEEQKPESYNDNVSRETPTNELGKMNIHDESTQKLDPNMKTGLQEHQNISAGNHDQFSPDAVTKPQFDAIIPNSQEFHDVEKQTPQSYNDKIHHDSSTNADSTVSFDQEPDQDSLDKKPVAGGYRETVSSISSSITNTVALAKDAVASKLGYGETEEQSGPEYQVVSTDSSSDKRVLVKEDNALSSKVINDALPVHKANEETPIDEATKVVKEERETELNEEKVVVKGRVTESEEVANRLGKAEDTDYDDAGPGLASPGKSVMDRLKDAAGSWFNKSGGEPHVEPRVELGDHIEEGNDRTQASTIKETVD
ncbi:uncharacterized protein LOC141605686 isoform X2 [Silene latifolia]